MDASMCLYQFLIAVRSEGSYQLTDEKGETTSHIIGMFYRTIRMLDNGLKPVYVFDGLSKFFNLYLSLKVQPISSQNFSH